MHRGWTSKENRRGGFRRRNELIEVDSVKIEEDFDWSTYNSTHNLRANTAKKEFVSLEDSDRIIDIFSMDAGDYRGMGREMPHLYSILNSEARGRSEGTSGSSSRIP